MAALSRRIGRFMIGSDLVGHFDKLGGKMSS